MFKLNVLVAAALAASLAGCGGGGGSAGTNTSGSSPAPIVVTPDAQVASFAYQLDKNSISNNGSDKAELTVTALDTKNNPVTGAAVTVSVDSGVYTPASPTTDASGQVNGTITIGGDKSNRQITAQVTVGGKTSSVVIPVVGSKLALTPVPATVAPGGNVTVTVKATDSNDNAIANVPVKLAGTLGFNQTVTTDSAGNASAVLGAAPAAPGSYTVTANGSGVDSTRDVQVVSLTGGAIPDAVGIVSAANLNISPNTIAPNALGASTNVARLRAVFQNATNQAIQNVRVRFVIAAPGLGSGERISTGDATVYSDGSGVATADYIAGTRSSPTNGVQIVACYGMNDAALAGVPVTGQSCPPGAQQTTAALTVGAQPLNITIGSNNEQEKGEFNLTYIRKFDIAVADAAGNAVPNAVISASVDLVEYGKGSYIKPADVTTPDTPTTPPVTPTTPTAIVSWCPNEDTNRNGFLDAGEDRNNNGTLEPRKADIVLSYGESNKTGANGRTVIQVEYPQNVATWLRYKVKVTTNVAGSEGTVIGSFITAFIKGDEENGSFLVSPYGTNPSCSSPN